MVNQNLQTNTYPVYDGYEVVQDYSGYFVPFADARARDKIEIGTSSNEVIYVMPKYNMICEPVVLGKDQDGIVVEWHYTDVIFTFAYVNREYESCYCVQQIQVKK